MSTPHPAPQLLSLRALARAIGVDAGQLSKESSRPGFPSRRTDDGGVGYDPTEVLQWRLANVRRKKSRPPMPAPAATAPGEVDRPGPVRPPRRPSPSAPDPPREMANETESHADADLLDVLQSGKCSPLEISRATVQIASRRVARAHREELLGPNDLDGLKKSLQELRSAEADYIALEKSRRELIARDEVRAIVAECCGRLVRVLGVLENSIAQEFSVWLGDPKLAEMDADDRARLVREFVTKTTRAARSEEADAIDQLISRKRDDD